MIEPFLINPYRPSRRRRRSVGRIRRSVARIGRRRRRTGLPSALLRRMIRTYGTRRGMKQAWKLYKRGIRRNVWADDARGHRLAALKGWRRRRSSRRRRLNPWERIAYPAHEAVLWRVKETGRFGRPPKKKNPFGEEVMIVGVNPRRRRRRRSRVRSRRRSFFLDNLFRRRRRRRLRDNFLENRRRRRLRYNARRRRRLRRNPVVRGGGLAISFRRPSTLLMPVAVGTAAFILTDRAPSMIGATSTWQRYGAKAAVGVGGSILISKFFGRTNGMVWLLASGINLATDLVKQYILPKVTALPAQPVSGYGAFPYAYDYGEPRGIGYEGFEAYPDEMAAGSYPFAGTLSY
jgi:hypothetical protein